MSSAALPLTRHDYFASLRSGGMALLTQSSGNTIYLTSAGRELSCRTTGEGELHLVFNNPPGDEPDKCDLGARDVPIRKIRVGPGVDEAARSGRYV